MPWRRVTSVVSVNIAGVRGAVGKNSGITVIAYNVSLESIPCRQVSYYCRALQTSVAAFS